MELGSGREMKVGIFVRGWWGLKALHGKLQGKVVEGFKKTKKLGQDDPRRVIHSLKVGLAITVVSLFYYLQTLYDSFGVYAMWAVISVVVTFEFSVGATLEKSINRGLATLLGGALGVGAHHLARISGTIGEPIILGVLVFLQAAISTFIRFFPKMKARYDYGLLIFILTFCLVAVSGLRIDEILEFALKRLTTIAIGASTAVIVSIFVCPVWAGEDLHNLVALNMEYLGSFVEGLGDEYFRTSENEESKNDEAFIHRYKSVLSSKNREDSLANFARWEPGHSQFTYRHPWKQYLKVGTLTRQCAYRIEALNGCLNSEIQVPQAICEKIQHTYSKMSLDSRKALKELALAIKTMTQPSSSDSHVVNSKAAANNLKSILKSDLWEDIDLLQVMPIATKASILIDIAICVEDIAKSVHDLALLAHFKSIDSMVPQK